MCTSFLLPPDFLSVSIWIRFHEFLRFCRFLTLRTRVCLFLSTNEECKVDRYIYLDALLRGNEHDSIIAPSFEGTECSRVYDEGRSQTK